jgi:pimeloyl-ACP methyl ester carboxylesterase
MVKSNKSQGRIIVGIITKVFVLLIGVVVVSTVFHQVVKVVEKNRYQAPGEYVQVDGKKMHVYSKGNGKKTIVLLGGYGTGSPVIDFSPLIKELSESYKVVVVENFGYGWSDVTERSRTSENIVNETRTALKEAGFTPPYILMPHSIWGVYSLYYANIYPNEIEGIVGIDSSVPSQMDLFGEDMKMSRLSALEEFTGYIRIKTKLQPDSVISKSASEAYTEEEIKLMRLMYCWHANNASLIEEFNSIYSNSEAVIDLNYPESIPVLFLLSQETADLFNDFGMNWISMHEKLIAGNKNSKITVLPGPHYLHTTCSKSMVKELQLFFTKTLY